MLEKIEKMQQRAERVFWRPSTSVPPLSNVVKAQATWTRVWMWRFTVVPWSHHWSFTPQGGASGTHPQRGRWGRGAAGSVCSFGPRWLVWSKARKGCKHKTAGLEGEAFSSRSWWLFMPEGSQVYFGSSSSLAVVFIVLRPGVWSWPGSFRVKGP